MAHLPARSISRLRSSRSIAAAAVAALMFTGGTASFAFGAGAGPQKAASTASQAPTSASVAATTAAPTTPASAPASQETTTETPSAEASSATATTPTPKTASGKAATAPKTTGATVGAVAAAKPACKPSPVTDPMNITVNPSTKVASGDIISVNFAGSISDGHCAGDSFSFQIPVQLAAHSVGTFKIVDKASGAVIANETVTSDGRVTVTLTDFVETHQHVSMQGYLKVQATGSVQPGTTVDLQWTVNGKVSTTPITYVPCVNCNKLPAAVSKWGWLSGDGKVVQTVVQTMPSTSADQVYTVTDKLTSPGQEFDCSGALAPGAESFTQVNAWGDPMDLKGVPTTVVSCSATEMKVTVKTTAANQALRIYFGARVLDAAAPSYTDAADVTTKDQTSPTQTVVKHPEGGGDGQGDVPAPKVAIVKGDAAGNAGDDANKPVQLGDAPAGTGLVMTVTNTGTEDLTDIKISDVTVGSGDVAELTCTFPDDSKGVTWAGVFKVGAKFTCTAKLTGVDATVHTDTATVNATGRFSGAPVTDSNPYSAVGTDVPQQPTVSPTPSTTAVPVPSQTPTQPPVSPTASPSKTAASLIPGLSNTGGEEQAIAYGAAGAMYLAGFAALVVSAVARRRS